MLILFLAFIHQDIVSLIGQWLRHLSQQTLTWVKKGHFQLRTINNLVLWFLCYIFMVSLYYQSMISLKVCKQWYWNIAKLLHHIFWTSSLFCPFYYKSCSFKVTLVILVGVKTIAEILKGNTVKIQPTWNFDQTRESSQCSLGGENKISYIRDLSLVGPIDYKQTGFEITAPNQARKNKKRLIAPDALCRQYSNQ